MKKTALIIGFLFFQNVGFAQIPTNGLVGYWPFNGNANDESGNGNNAAAYGAALTTDRFGNSNSCYSLNGTSDYLETNNLFSSILGASSRSVSLWLKTSRIGKQSAIVWGSQSGCYGKFNVGVSNASSSSVSVKTGCDSVDCQATVLDGNWHHIVCVFDSAINKTIAAVKFYVDGAQILFDPGTTFTDSLNTQPGKIVFGKDGNNDLFQGSIDDICIYNRALNKTEIQNLFEYKFEFLPHFVLVWSGNGVDQMNINVYSALLDGLDLTYGDEIGVYDGNLCVGAGIVSGTISTGNILRIATSADEGIGNGFSPGNPIRFRFYDRSEKKEILRLSAVYNGVNPSWSTDGLFSVGATAFAVLNGIATISQTQTFDEGWNIFSINNLPADPDLKSLFQPLISNNLLTKIQDENGDSMEDYGVFGGWNNNIGNIALTEGYKIKVKGDCEIIFTGTPATFPLKIPLYAGWNIIGYPRESEADGKAVLQPLIDNGTLIKAQDEKGNSIEDWGMFGGWVNFIGNFSPGEGYKIKVNADDTITIYESYAKSGHRAPAKAAATAHFQPVSEGNGLDHMNINLVNIPGKMWQPGDELAVFDGEICVGAVGYSKLWQEAGGSINSGTTEIQQETDSSQQQTDNNQQGASSRQFLKLSIPVAASDGTGSRGYTEGNPVILKIWNSASGKEFIVEPEIIRGSSTFLKHETTFASLEKLASLKLEDKIPPGETDIKIYPNPTSGKVYFSAGSHSSCNCRIQVLSTTGQMIIDQWMIGFPGEIDLSGSVPGIYYVKVTSTFGTSTEKLLLK